MKEIPTLFAPTRSTIEAYKSYFSIAIVNAVCHMEARALQRGSNLVMPSGCPKMSPLRLSTEKPEAIAKVTAHLTTAGSGQRGRVGVGGEVEERGVRVGR